MDPLEAHLCSKQIINRYQEMIATKRIIGGMFLFTEPNGLHREAYGGSYTYTVKEQLRSYLEELTGSGEIDRSRWQIYSMGDEAFLLRILGSGGVYSVCAVDLNRSLRPQDSTDPQNGVLLYAAPDGQLLTSQEWAKQEVQIQWTSDSFYQAGNGQYLAVQQYSEVAGVWFVYLTPYRDLLHHMDFAQLLLLMASIALLVLLPICYYIFKTAVL